jgi:hypothetical protein
MHQHNRQVAFQGDQWMHDERSPRDAIFVQLAIHTAAACNSNCTSASRRPICFSMTPERLSSTGSGADAPASSQLFNASGLLAACASNVSATLATKSGNPSVCSCFQNGFADMLVAPDGIEQVIFGDEHAGLARQGAQDCEGFGGEWNRRSITAQPCIGLVEVERIESDPQCGGTMSQHPPAWSRLPSFIIRDPKRDRRNQCPPGPYSSICPASRRWRFSGFPSLRFGCRDSLRCASVVGIPFAALQLSGFPSLRSGCDSANRSDPRAPTN